MTAVRIVIVTSAIVAASVSPAAGESVVVSQKTKLRASPGEMGRVVTRLRPGQTGKILMIKGRWLMVQVGAKSGWVTRTTVSDARPRKRRRRRKRARRWGRKSSKAYGSWRNKAMVTSRAQLPRRVVVRLNTVRAFTKPTAWGKVAFTASRDAELSVLAKSRRGRWYLVQTDDGPPGWIPAAAILSPVSKPTRLKPRPRRTLAAQEDSPNEPANERVSVERQSDPEKLELALPPLPAPRGLRLAAGVGVQTIASSFHSNGTAGLANYDLNTSAPNLTVNAHFYRQQGPISLGLLGSYRGVFASPGPRYRPSSGGSEGVKLFSHVTELLLAVGTRVSTAARGIRFYVIGGYRYGVTLTDSLDNIAALPNESMSGVVLGGEIRLERTVAGIALSASAYTLVGGSLGQTVGLMDGANSDVSALYARTCLSRQLTSDWFVQANYHYDSTTTLFSGASSRQPDVTEASRTDASHTVSLGIERRL